MLYRDYLNSLVGKECEFAWGDGNGFCCFLSYGPGRKNGRILKTEGDFVVVQNGRSQTVVFPLSLVVVRIDEL